MNDRDPCVGFALPFVCTSVRLCVPAPVASLRLCVPAFLFQQVCFVPVLLRLFVPRNRIPYFLFPVIATR